MIRIEVFSAHGCDRCAGDHARLRQIATAVLGEATFTWREIDVLDELDYAVTLGVLSMPAIAINGALVFPALPDANQWQAHLATLRDAS